MAKRASKELEAFIDEALCQCVRAGYHPTVFRRLRDQHGLVEAIEKLVRSGEIQSGFRRLKTLNILEWSIEEAVIRFSDEFTPIAQECAEFRLRLAREGGKA
jgi:hypothetical protein